MWAYIERKLAEAKTVREARWAYAARLAAAPDCQHCDGEGETRVRGMRSVTGYEVCCHCGGSGKDVSVVKDA